MKTPIVILSAAVLLAACSSEPERVYPPSGGASAPGPGGYNYPRPSALDSAGRNSLANGDLAAADDSFQQELDSNPFDPIALNNLAVARSEEGKYQDALTLLERATKLAPDNVEIAANLSRMRAYEGLQPAGAAAAGDANGFAYVGQSGPLAEPPPLWQPLPVGVPAAPIPVRRARAVSTGCYARTYRAPTREQSEVKVCDTTS